MGVKHIWYLPLAVDVDLIDMILQKSEDSVKYRGDIAFVGSLFMRGIPTTESSLRRRNI